MIQSPAGYQGDVRIKRYLDFYQAGYGVAMLSSGTTAFTPASLFAASEPGGWYDPSDLTTLYQDAAGTTPVTAVEQPVGLVLDKSKNGVGTNGSKRLNLLSWSEAFDNSAWTKFAVTITSNSIAAPNGDVTADTAQRTSVSNSLGRSQTLAATAYKLSIYAKSGTMDQIRLTIATSGYALGAVCDFDLSAESSAITQYGGTTGSSATIEAVNDGWYLLSLTVTATVATYFTEFTLNAAGTIYIWGADLRPASEAATLPTYQRITADWPSTMSGAHLSQSTAAARPVLSSRVNLLTYTEQFDNAAWNKTVGGASNSVTPNTTTAPNGTLTADTFTFQNAANVWGGYEPDIQLVAGVAYTFSIWIKRKSGTSQIRLNVNPYALPWVDVAVTSEWQQVSVTQTPSSTTTPAQTCGILAANASGDEIYIWGADLRPANSGVGLPAYQRVGAATSGSSTAAGNADYDTTGFPLFLRFDGTDDFLQSSTITPGADKAQVFAGVRKLSDAATGMLVELSTSVGSNNGTFDITAPNSTGYGFELRGSALSTFYVPTGFAAPHTGVLSGLFDIAGAARADEVIPRINGTVSQSGGGGNADTGTGNFGSYPLYVGSRAGAGLRFNGHLYSLIFRFSAANLDAATITATETWVNGKTKAF